VGEANYYLKARFPSEQQAEAAKPRLIELLAEGDKACDFWQDSDDPMRRDDPKWQAPSAESFWKTFRARYPLVYRYLRHLTGTPNWKYELEEWLRCFVDERQVSLVRVADTLFLQLNDTWHFSQLDLLERYCREDLGAVGVGWKSEEDFDFDERQAEGFNPFLSIDT
jgi:hypothetical protein